MGLLLELYPSFIPVRGWKRSAPSCSSGLSCTPSRFHALRKVLFLSHFYLLLPPPSSVFRKECVVGPRSPVSQQYGCKRRSR